MKSSSANAIYVGNLSGGGLQVAKSYINDLLNNPNLSCSIYSTLIINKRIFDSLSFSKQIIAKKYFQVIICENNNTTA